MDRLEVCIRSTRHAGNIVMKLVLRHRRSFVIALLASTVTMPANGRQHSTPGQAPEPRPRARDLGIVIGVLPPGPGNAITDVPGVLVGHTTLVEGDGVRTGVTAIIPHGGNVFQEKVPAAIVVGNGFGKLVGSTQVDELGTIETPIVLTNTLSVFAAADALLDYSLKRPGNEKVRSVNAIAAETNDGYLNDIRNRRVRREDVLAALEHAKGGAVDEGCVGAGTGTRCLGWKGGIGTASRKVPDRLGGWTVGVLTQTNFDGILTIAGAPVGRELGRYYLAPSEGDGPSPGGSCVIVVATDAPLDARQLRRLANRALLGLAAAGSPMQHGSGDYVIAFSTAESVRISHESTAAMRTVTVARDEALSPLFQATREAVEEAIVNSLLKAVTVTGYQGRIVEAIPIDRVVEICRHYKLIRP